MDDCLNGLFFRLSPCLRGGYSYCVQFPRKLIHFIVQRTRFVGISKMIFRNEFIKYATVENNHSDQQNSMS